ncbi:hypothetical protein ABZ297_15660 [Nonomuraea sp. NPDC005983]|uniref:hypothetical protein n=1 Tax=Nonomuraea sp. NPDC005983 TaxID=3155595 RepID=UPI0033BF6456
MADWAAARHAYRGDVHAELAGLAVLTGTNADVDRLNAAARAMRCAAGELTSPEVRYRLRGGRALALAVGDHVRIRRNDYRARRRELDAELPALRERQAQLRERLAPVRESGRALEEAARQAAEQPPPEAVWPLIRRRHADLERDFDAAQRGVRGRDVTTAQQRAHTARQGQACAQHELTAVQQELVRRADLPPDRREVEQTARAEHAERGERERQAAAERGPERPAPGRASRRDRTQAYRPPPGPHRKQALSSDRPGTWLRTHDRLTSALAVRAGASVSPCGVRRSGGAGRGRRSRRR